MNEENLRITGIAPANGWWAGYKDDDGTVWFSRLAVFVSPITADEDRPGVNHHEVAGMDAVDMQSFSFASKANAFRGYYYDDDFEVLGEKLKAFPQDRFDSGGA